MPTPVNTGAGQENVRVENVEWDTTAPVEETTQFERLPTDIYVMEIAEAYVEEDRMYGRPHPQTGLYPKKLVLVWETTNALSPEQQDAGIAAGERVWQRMTPTLRDNPNGGPSAFKAFVISLQEQGMLREQFKPADFVGITQRVSVLEYTNQNGRQSNKVTGVSPLQRRRQAATRNAAPVQAAGTPVQEGPATGATRRLASPPREGDADGDGFIDTPVPQGRRGRPAPEPRTGDPNEDLFGDDGDEGVGEPIF